MTNAKMRPGEVDIDHELVTLLVHSQFPDYANLLMRRVDSAGTDNAMYRLGDDLVVRLPRLPSAESQVHREHTWLPRIARELPLAVPTPVELGAPGHGYAMSWSIYRWIDGEDAYKQPISNLSDAAVRIANFGATLRRLDASSGPPCFRGRPLALQEHDVLAAITDLSTMGVVDQAAALSAWRTIVGLPQWTAPPVWTHGDLLPGNLLGLDGRLHAVIDFGGLGVGDPACDMMVAWTLLTANERDVFREHSAVDDATWDRGRGWAFGFGLMAYHFYHVKNPVLADVGRRSFTEALAEFSD